MAVIPPNSAAIYSALFALAAGAKINGVAAFAFSKQRLIQPESVDAAPALLMEQLPEDYEGGVGKHAKVILRARLWIFAQTPLPSDDRVPSDVLNPLKDAVLAALAPPPATYPNQTLGGLVTHTWIDGKTWFAEGLADQWGIVALPVTMVASF